MTLEIVEQPVEVCNDGIDNDNDNLADCEDPSCIPDAACAEVCDDGLDDNNSGPADCLDGPYCGTDPVCCPLNTANLGQNMAIVNNTNQVNEPSCLAFGGFETSFEFTPPNTGDYLLSTTNSDFSNVISVRESCGGPEISCNAFVDPVVNLQAGVPYVIYVDALFNSTPLNGGNVELNIAEVTATEMDCTNGLDEDLDGRTDCDDADCASAPNCLEFCDNGVDDDGDGLIDCDDRGCVTDAMCCPVNLTTGVGTYTGTTVGASDLVIPTCGFNTGADTTFEFTAPADGAYTFDTTGSNFDTVTAILDGCGGTELACDSDLFSGETIGLFLTAGQTVIVVVDGAAGATGAVTLSIQ